MKYYILFSEHQNRTEHNIIDKNGACYAKFVRCDGVGDGVGNFVVAFATENKIEPHDM